MNDASNNIDIYCNQQSTPPSELLNELERETYLKTLAPQMISGPLQGRLLSMLSKMLNPNLIVEVGTFTGYGTLCLAEGLQADGQIITIEINPELNYISDHYFNRSPYKSNIKAIHGDAKSIIIDEGFNDIDIAFIDATKSQYGAYFELLVDRIRPGGLIMADNVLWSGKVIHEKRDSDTQSIHDFNQKIAADPRVEQLILPIRDGLMVMRRV